MKGSRTRSRRRNGFARRSTCSTATRASSTTPTRCRRGCRSRPTRPSRALDRHPLRHPRAVRAPRVPDRAHPGRRHLLHRRRATTSPGRAGCGGRCPRGRPVHHLARADDRLPRGRAGASPAGRPDGLQPRAAQPLAPARLLGLRSRRGLGAVRRAADGRPGLPGRPGRPARHARRPVAARGPRRRSTSACTSGCPAPAEVGGGAWDYDKAWRFLSRPLVMAEGVPALRAGPVPRLAGAGPVVQARRAALAADCATRPRARRPGPTSTSRTSTGARSTSAPCPWTC